MSDRNSPCPFPVGAIYITTVPTNPTNTRPDSYRVAFGKGRCLVCVDDTKENMKNPEMELGSAGLTQQDITQGEEGGTVKVTTGASNYQPSITVYMRKRVSGKSQVPSYNPFNVTEEQASPERLYGKNVIIDHQTLKPKQPNPYSPS